MAPSPSLSLLLQEPQYTNRKTRYIERRKAFTADLAAQDDLGAFHRRDNAHVYTALPGLVPESVVGKVSSRKGMPYARSDSFFTDFALRHPNDVLSSSQDSLIIGNKASHDVRLYAAQWDPEHVDRSKSAGMAYFHFLVMPKQKVYNIVSLTDSAIIIEMISHFKDFWAQPGAAQKCIDRINRAVDERAEQVLAHLDHKQSSQFNEVMRDVRRYAEECSVRLRTLTAQDFIFGFHAMPDASLGHLHMHVLPLPETFRQFSTHVHDAKTIPACAVIEVLQAEGG